MTDADKIRAAWEKCPPFPEDRRWRVHVPMERLTAAPCDADISEATEFDFVEFRHERGVQEMRPVRRVIGKFRDTEICVACVLV